MIKKVFIALIPSLLRGVFITQTFAIMSGFLMWFIWKIGIYQADNLWTGIYIIYGAITIMGIIIFTCHAIECYNYARYYTRLQERLGKQRYAQKYGMTINRDNDENNK